MPVLTAITRSAPRLRALLPLLLLTAAAPPAAIDLPGGQLFPESVSIGPGDIAYVSSMHGGVLRVALKTEKVEPWIAPGAYGSGAEYGVFADPRNRLLWTCTNDFSAQGVTVAGSDTGAWVKAFDLKSGHGRLSLKLPGEKATCNDFAVARDGSVLVADTANPRILRWRPGTTALETWVTDPVFEAAAPASGGLDGIAIGGDGNVYVNNVRSGALYRVTWGPGGRAGAVTKLAPSRPLVSPDGMRAAGGMRLVVAEGQGRITALDVAGDQVQVTTLAEGIVTPTGVAVARDGTVWYVQGQLGALFKRPGAQTPSLPFRLTPVGGSR